MYGRVEFNSFVQNQTINVNNGTLKLGKFAGATLEVNATTLIVPETGASLENVDLTVASGASLEIDAALVIADTVIYLSSGATMSLLEGASITLNLGEVDGEFSYKLINFADESDMIAVLSALQTDGAMALIANDVILASDNWTVAQGTGEASNWIVVSGTTVPEPATYAAIFGALALGFATWRKRK